MHIKMRHIVISTALLAVLLLAVTPWVIGRNVRELAITNTLNLLPAEMRRQVRIDNSSVTSGWRQSHIELDLTFQPIDDLPVKFHLTMNVQHGPLLITADALALGLVYVDINPQLDNESSRAVRAELPFDLPTLQLNLLVGLRNTLHLNVALSPVNYAGPDGQLDFAGLQAQFVTFPDLAAEFSLHMGTLAAQEPATAFEFNMDGIDIHMASAQINDLLAPASATFRVPAFSSAAPYPINVSDIAVDTRIQPSTAGAERTDFYQRMAVGRVDSDLPVSALSWTSELNETRNDLLRRYYALMVQIQNDSSSNGGNIGAQASQAAEELGVLVLQNRLVFNNAITATAYAGDHSADLRVLWQGLPNMRNLFALNLNEALAALAITLDISLDLEAVMRSPMADRVDAYVQQGFLQLANGRIVVHAILRDSELTVNGDSMPLENLFQLAAGSN